MGKFYTFFDLCDKLLYAIVRVPVDFHVVSLGLVIDGITNAIDCKEAVKDLPKALVWISEGGFFKFVRKFFWDKL